MPPSKENFAGNPVFLGLRKMELLPQDVCYAPDVRSLLESMNLHGMNIKLNIEQNHSFL